VLVSTSELATPWQLPRARVKHARLPRATVRRATAPPDIDRDQTRMLLRDERGPVAIAPTDRKCGHALIGGQGGGKSSVMARHFANDARDRERAVILIDPKGPLAELCLGLAPSDRTVHYLDLGRPEIGLNPLAIKAIPGARAAVFLQALIEANPPGAIQAASDSFLRQAVAAVCTVEPHPTLWHVYRLLDVTASRYREHVVERLSAVRGAEFARAYWAIQFPALISDRGYAAQALNPPRNKLERLISTREIVAWPQHSRKPRAQPRASAGKSSSSMRSRCRARLSAWPMTSRSAKHGSSTRPCGKRSRRTNRTNTATANTFRPY
jgi:hypothetical protein